MRVMGGHDKQVAHLSCWCDWCLPEGVDMVGFLWGSVGPADVPCVLANSAQQQQQQSCSRGSIKRFKAAGTVRATHKVMAAGSSRRCVAGVAAAAVGVPAAFSAAPQWNCLCGEALDRQGGVFAVFQN
jgi:hypothetical protein